MLTYKDLLFTGPEAVCVLDSGLEIRQHNQLLSLLLGYRRRKLTGQHLSSILQDDMLIRHLLSQDGDSGWFQGECTLKMSADRPLIVKFRAGPVADEDLFPVHQEITDIIYHPSENRFLPYSVDMSEETKPGTASSVSSEAKSVAASKGYVLIFRERAETQNLSYERQIRSLQFLLNAVSEQDMEQEDILLGFARAFDQHAETMLLPPDFGEAGTEGEEHRFLLPGPAIEIALEAMREKTVTSYRGEDLWYFFPVYSQPEARGIACIKFAIPRFYSEGDRNIFSLAGRVLGAYVKMCTSGSQVASAHPLLETVLNDIDYPVFVVDRKGVITLCNAAIERIYGYSVSEMIGKSFGQLAFPANSPIQYEELLAQVMQGDPIYYEEMLHIRSDLTFAQVSLTAYPYRLDDGLIVGGIFIMRDLREKRRLWDKMLQWERLSALGEILSSVANELNNPLTSLTGYSYLLLNRNENAEISSMASTIYEEARRCGDIVHSVLDLARGNETQKEFAHVNDVIAMALNLKRRQLRPNNIEIYENLGEDIPGVIAEPHDMERLFLRLINYAEKRMVEYDNGGQLTIESAFENGKVAIRFTDTGTCVLEDDVAEIIDPFFTGGEGEGVGLGLGISCQILSNVGGKIRVEPEIGKGNVFTIELPVVEGIASDVLVHNAETDAFVMETGKSILVVDDEPAIVEWLSELLRHMGHITDIAGDGNEAMKKLETGTYDLIIADLRMPSGFTGDRLHRFIELKDPELAQRIIFITGDVINPETRKFLQSTGNLYLEKPFPPESLQKAIETSLGKEKAAK
ncbi:response regulator [Candidatus Poribacteria bacterium]